MHWLNVCKGIYECVCPEISMFLVYFYLKSFFFVLVYPYNINNLMRHAYLFLFSFTVVFCFCHFFFSFSTFFYFIFVPVTFISPSFWSKKEIQKGFRLLYMLSVWGEDWVIQLAKIKNIPPKILKLYHFDQPLEEGKKGKISRLGKTI